jgi:hypothetical protein
MSTKDEECMSIRIGMLDVTDNRIAASLVRHFEAVFEKHHPGHDPYAIDDEGDYPYDA